MKIENAIKKLTAAHFTHAPDDAHHTYTNGKFFISFSAHGGEVQMIRSRRVGVFSDSRQDFCAHVFHENISKALRHAL